jgi:MYXO-CTERM domain-containing protein
MKGKRMTGENVLFGARYGWLIRALGAVLLTEAIAVGAQAQEPALIVGDASGDRGDTVAITVSLQDGGSRPVTAHLDLLFPEDVLSAVVDPNSGIPECQMAPGVTGHQLIAVLNPPNDPPPAGQTKMRLGILDLVPPPTAVLSGGDLVTCFLRIAADAALGEVVLVAEKLELAEGESTGFTVICGFEQGQSVCGKKDGRVTVSPRTPTDTPTEVATDTPVPPTATRTLTPVPPTPTLSPLPPTPTLSPLPPTATRTTAASPTKTQGSSGGGGGGCSITPTGETSPAGVLLLFAGSLLLVWARRRHR